MKYLNLSKTFAVLAISALVFTACDKVDVQKSIGDAGQTLVKFIGGGTSLAPGTKLAAIDFVNIPVKIMVVDLRRDIPNPTELNKTMTVVIKDDNAAVAAADPSLVILPAAWYTIDPANPKVGGNFTIVLAPGEFARQLYITVPNATLLDPATTYGLGFTITSADANGVISEQYSLVVKIGAKNAYDGIYSITGNFQHPTYGPGAGQTFGTAADGGLLECSMNTIGANECSREGVTPAGDIGGYDGFVFFLTAALGGPGYTGFSNVFPAYAVNPGTNVVTVYPKPGSGNTVTWLNNGSSYNPGTKTFNISSGYAGSPNRLIFETWVYQRPR